MSTIFKKHIEETFGRPIVNRGDCELLAQKVYQKTGVLISYNTLRRFFGLAETRKTRNSTLDLLAVYIGFHSYHDFIKRFEQIDWWPTWQQLFIALSVDERSEVFELLRYHQSNQVQFSISVSIVLREWIFTRKREELIALFRHPAFQFKALSYDDASQIGVVTGLLFRNFHDPELEKVLLNEANFRDIIFKIFVDYSRLNGSYGDWIVYVLQLKDLDEESRIFCKCLLVWKQLLAAPLDSITPIQHDLPALQLDLHPILVGRLWGLHYLMANTDLERQQLESVLKARMALSNHTLTELLYEPCMQALVLNHEGLCTFIAQFQQQFGTANFWYNYSQIALQKLFLAKRELECCRFEHAKELLLEIPFGQIRHGYREFIELFVSFFQWKIAIGLGEDTEAFVALFIAARAKIPYPIFSNRYFDQYFCTDESTTH
ncbi:MAG: hypothetical protein RLZZ301_1679 [Bacteroidota bacterium]